jgi:glycosyltransferase involved in cell wall biosynthesis
MDDLALARHGATVVRFVLVSDRLSEVRGGIERHAEALARELRQRGHRVDLVRPREIRSANLHRVDWLVYDGVHRLAILRHRPRGEGAPRLAIFPHGSFLEEVHEAELRSGGRWRPNGRFRGRRWFDRLLGRRVFAAIDRWFVLAPGEAGDVARFLGVPPARIHVSPPFVSPEYLEAARSPSRPSPVAAPYVVAVGRIEPRKNLGELVRASAGAPFSVAVAGQDRGGLEPLRTEASKLPGARWRYLGELTEAEKVGLLRAADALVIPSVSEGVPAIALESLVLGRPVVLAGVAYGPEGPGVFRCGPDAASLRTAIDRARAAPPPTPRAPRTVAECADGFLAGLAER